MNKNHSRIKKLFKEEEIEGINKALNSKVGGTIQDALTKILDSYLREAKPTMEDMRNTNWPILRAFYDGQENIVQSLKDILKKE